jgi:FdhD protein
MKKSVPPTELKDNEHPEPISSSIQALDWRRGNSISVTDQVIRETAVALVYNGISHVVMMTTPVHLEDFALGFSLTEGILNSPSELYGIEINNRDNGIEIAMEISAERFASLKNARRNLTGRTGCGLCGAESLDQAIRMPRPVHGSGQFSHKGIEKAVSQLEKNQYLQAITGAVHGAALCTADGNIELIREDVGRHNALDKLCGAIHRDTFGNKSDSQAQADKILQGYFVLISSRASYEMVLKAAVIGFDMLVAVSAPTQYAIDLAEKVNMTLVGFARPDRHMIYTNAQRVA